jgi:hypothetical protein
MVIKLDPDLEVAIKEQARQQGVAPEALALSVLRERFQGITPLPPPQDEWERMLRNVATDCGVSLSNEALSREELYD